MIKDRIVRAYNFAKKKHKGQFRAFSKLPYFTHPKAVARILEYHDCDENLIIAGLLHDVCEDCGVTPAEIYRRFGDPVAQYVAELTSNKITQKEMGKTQYLIRKMSEMSEEALTIKLADRLHNVLYLPSDAVPMSFIEKYFKETEMILEGLRAFPLYRPTAVQRALVARIYVVLAFIKLRYFDAKK